MAAGDAAFFFPHCSFCIILIQDESEKKYMNVIAVQEHYKNKSKK